MIKKKNFSQADKKTWENYIKNPSNIYDKETDGVTAIPDEVKNICTAAWTTDVKALWKAKLIADKSSV